MDEQQAKNLKVIKLQNWDVESLYFDFVKM